MPAPNVNTADLVDAVKEADGVKNSVIAFISKIGARIQVAVDAALVADDAADQGSVDAANAAIADEVAKIKAVSAELGAAINA